MHLNISSAYKNNNIIKIYNTHSKWLSIIDDGVRPRNEYECTVEIKAYPGLLTNMILSLLGNADVDSLSKVTN